MHRLKYLFVVFVHFLIALCPLALYGLHLYQTREIPGCFQIVAITIALVWAYGIIGRLCDCCGQIGHDLSSGFVDINSCQKQAVCKVCHQTVITGKHSPIFFAVTDKRLCVYENRCSVCGIHFHYSTLHDPKDTYPDPKTPCLLVTDCVVCHEVLRQMEIHDWDNDSDLCNYTRKCLRCGLVETITDNHHWHSEDGWGYEVCTRCGVSTNDM